MVAAPECAQTFEFTVETASRFVFRQASEDRVVMRGRLALRALPSQAERGAEAEGWWALHLEQVELHASGTHTVDPDYAEPFALRRDPAGRIGGFWFPAHVGDTARDKLRGFAYLLQFQPDAPTGRVRESDQLGAYRASYAREDGAVVRRKQAYETQALDDQVGKAFVEVEVVASESRWWPSRCWLDRLEAEETLRFVSEGESFSLRSHQRTRLEVVEGTLGVLATLPDQLRDWPVRPAPATAPLDAAARRALAARLGEGVRQLGEPLPDADALVSWLREFDPVLDSLHGMLLQHALDDAVEKRLFLSLGLLDTAASQNLLVASVLDPRLDSQQRFRAIRALVQGNGPLSEQAMAEIGRLLDPVMTLGDEELDTAFILAVGSMIDERRGMPGIDALQAQLASRLVIASDADRPRVVSALGNTHDPSLVEQVADYRDAPSPRLRRNVAQAMGQFGDERAGEVLDAMLRTEADASVRATVLHSLGRYTLDRKQTEIVLNDAAASTDEAVRHAAIGALGRQELDDGSRQQLKGMLKTETSRRNFQAIVRALHGKPGTGSSPQ